MSTQQIQIPDTDPVAIPAKKAIIDHILEENNGKPGATMVVLNELQSQIGFVSEHMQEYVAHQMKVPVSTIHGVVSFYSVFTPAILRKLFFQATIRLPR